MLCARCGHRVELDSTADLNDAAGEAGGGRERGGGHDNVSVQLIGARGRAHGVVSRTAVPFCDWVVSMPGPGIPSLISMMQEQEADSFAALRNDRQG